MGGWVVWVGGQHGLLWVKGRECFDPRNSPPEEPAMLIMLAPVVGK